MYLLELIEKFLRLLESHLRNLRETSIKRGIIVFSLKVWISIEKFVWWVNPHLRRRIRVLWFARKTWELYVIAILFFLNISVILISVDMMSAGLFFNDLQSSHPINQTTSITINDSTKFRLQTACVPSASVLTTASFFQCDVHSSGIKNSSEENLQRIKTVLENREGYLFQVRWREGDSTKSVENISGEDLEVNSETSKLSYIFMSHTPSEPGEYIFEIVTGPATNHSGDTISSAERIYSPQYLQQSNFRDVTLLFQMLVIATIFIGSLQTSIKLMERIVAKWDE